MNAKLISMSKNRKKAEVTVISGGRSITRHLHFKDGKWYGRPLEAKSLKRKEKSPQVIEYEF